MNKYYYVLLAICMLSWAACEECEEIAEIVAEPQFESLPRFDFGLETTEDFFLAINSEEIEAGQLCTETQYKWAAGDEESILYDPSTSVIYLGSLIDGGSLADGSYRELVFPKKQISGSISLPNLASVTFQIDNPKLSTVREVLTQKFQQEVTGSTPAKISFESYSIQSLDKLRVALKASLNSPFVEVSGSYNMNNENIKTRKLIRYVQEYFTVDMDPPNQPEAFFLDPLNAYQEITQGSSYSPVYVAQVKYGRMLMMMIESTRSAAEVQAALDASFEAANVSGQGGISVEEQEILDETSIKVLAIGGSGTSAIQTITNGYEGFKAYLEDGAEFGPNSPGVKLAYTLKYLSDNSIAQVVLSSEYTVSNCSEASIGFQDIREARCGQSPTNALEAYLDLLPGHVLTGIGTEVKGDNVHTLRVEMRKLFPNGMMGERINRYWIDGTVYEDSDKTSSEVKTEAWSVVEDGHVITYYAGDMNDNELDLDRQLVEQREIVAAAGSSIIRLINPDTLVSGDIPSIYQAACPEQPNDPTRNVILGIGMTVNSGQITTIMMRMGKLE